MKKNSYDSRAPRFFVQTPRRLRETMGSGKEHDSLRAFYDIWPSEASKYLNICVLCKIKINRLYLKI